MEKVVTKHDPHYQPSNLWSKQRHALWVTGLLLSWPSGSGMFQVVVEMGNSMDSHMWSPSAGEESRMKPSGDYV